MRSPTCCSPAPTPVHSLQAAPFPNANDYQAIYRHDQREPRPADPYALSRSIRLITAQDPAAASSPP